MNKTALVSRDQIQQLLTLEDIIGIVEEVYTAHGRGKVSMPAKITLDMGASGEPNWLNAMPAYIPDAQAGGIKWAGGFLHNPTARNLEYVQAMIILNDPITGQPLAIMDGGAITTARTGATAAVAAKVLGRPKTGRVVMFGAGAQARSTARAIQVACPWVKEFIVRDVRREAAEGFVEEMQPELRMDVSFTEEPAEAVASADIVVTATTANEPLVMKDWVSPGTLVITLGSYQELDPRLVLEADRLIVDDRDQCLIRGELVPLLESGQLNPDDVQTEIGHILAEVQPGRRRADEIIVADLIGLGSIDIVCARRVYEKLDADSVQTFTFY